MLYCDKEIEENSEEMETNVVQGEVSRLLSHVKIKFDSTLIVEGESWKHTNIFNNAVSCKSQLCLLFINNGSVLNGVSQDLVSKLGLVTEPLTNPYTITWINGTKVTLTLMCKLIFYFGRHYKETVSCNVLLISVRQILLGRP